MRTVVSMSALFFFFKQKTAYEMRISDWSSDVCSSDLHRRRRRGGPRRGRARNRGAGAGAERQAKHGNGAETAVIDHVSESPLPRCSMWTAIAALNNGANKLAPGPMQRSEKRRVGKEGVSTCRFRWSHAH